MVYSISNNKMDKHYPKVAILILNWNGWKDTIECLESVFRITYPNYQVIVIDNGSTDGSIERIKAWAEGKQEVLTPEPSHPLYYFSHPPVKKPIPYIEYNRKEAEGGGNPELEKSLMINWLNSKAHLQNNHTNSSINPTTQYPLISIQTGANLGFAGGNNVGIRYALKRGFDYVLLLNNDTVVDKNFIEPLVKVFQTETKVAAVGSKVYYYDRPNVINFAGGKINLWKGTAPHIGINQIDDGQFNQIKKVDYVIGCALMASREAFEKIGLLDEKYFIYTEEVDWCFNACKLGYKVLFVPQSKIWHKISASAGILSDFSIYHFTKNKIYFLKKNGKFYHWFVFILYFTLINLFRMWKAKRISTFRSIINGIIHGFLSF